MISAPAAEVWSVLVDGSRYPEWNPFILRVDGDLREHASVRYRFRFLVLRAWATARVLTVQPQVELRWAAHALNPAVFQGEHYFRITARSPSEVSFSHGEIFSGLLAPLVWPLLRSCGPRVYEGLNRALQARVEPTRPLSLTPRRGR